MGGTRKGGQLAAERNKQRHGDDFYRKIGAKGGRISRKGGFAGMPFEKVSAAGKKGGKISRRKAAV